MNYFNATIILPHFLKKDVISGCSMTVIDALICNAPTSIATPENTCC